MPNYTGLRCRVVIKPDYIGEMHKIALSGFDWSSSKYDFIRKLKDLMEGLDIPNSELVFPMQWKEDGLFDRDSPFYEPRTGLFYFQCSVNYNRSGVEYFIETVINEIADWIMHLEVVNEYDDCSVFYWKYGESIYISDREGINYNY